MINFRSSYAAQLLTAVLFIPVTFLFLISIFKTCYVDRYFFASFPFFIATVATGLSRLNKKLLVLLLSIIIVFNIYALKEYYANKFPIDATQHVAVSKKQDFRKILAYLLKNYHDGDIIMHTCKNSVFPLKLYSRLYSGDSNLIKKIDRGTVVFLSPDKKNLFTFDYNLLYAITASKNEYKFFSGIGKKERLWLIFPSWDFPYVKNKEHAVFLKLKTILVERGYGIFKDAYLYLFEGKD
jgi:hypothetical protein